MQRALELARSVLGTTSPNPAVGCVIVKDGVVIGEGATQPPGGPHAERVALDKADQGAQGATMYVTLEPHNFQGRTPPCTQAIIEAKIAEVRIATLDPNPQVNGKGMTDLQAAGIKTHLGDGESAARQVNEAYFKWVATKRPFVYAKFAMSLDGKIATRTGDSKWITSEAARAKAHELRSIVDAIMVGATTVHRDDPRLTARLGEEQPARRQPVRVIVDSRGRTPVAAKLLKEPGKTIIAVTANAPTSSWSNLISAGAEVIVAPDAQGRVDLNHVLELLGKRSITSILVEGGGTLLASLFEQKLVDKVYAFIAPIIVGGREATTPVEGQGIAKVAEALRLKEMKVERIGEDLLIEGYV
jgi:diaminohydroxyphosphoribosylaminopyrimidine deaminase/5-amino-6-(5-phosphoribosylamino)uracil reductase